MKKLFIFLFIGLCLVSFNQVKAQGLKDAFGSPLSSVATKAGYDTSKTDIDPFISKTITFVLSFLGVIFLGLMIYGGFQWMVSMGNEKKVEESRNLLIAATIGLIIVLLAYAISIMVMENIASQTLK